ncbi:MAG TPA: universal stress protein [Magnetospirillaceae bacterium]|jgi:nucleotide-binding universal stress UspA family protein
MTIGTILVPLLGDAGDGDCLAWAGTLAQKHKSHVIALHPSPNPSDALYALATSTPEVFVTETMERTLREQTSNRRAAVKRRYTAWAESAGVACGNTPAAEGADCTAKLVVDPETVEPAVLRYALVSDLIVTVLPGKGMERRIEPLNAALFDAGRPVLGVSAGSTSDILGAPAIVAWNGSSEAARALTAALPLLRDASSVTILHAGEPDTMAALDPVTAYLDHHHIKSQGIELGAHGNPTELIATKISELGARLLVMGAYSHSRLRESVLGGVTREMLAGPPVALLMAH